MLRSPAFGKFGSAALMAAFAVTGCGGDSMSGNRSAGPLPVPATSSAISAIALNSNTRNISTDNGLLDAVSNIANVGTIHGTLNNAKNQFVLFAGGGVDLSPALNGHAARFVSTPTGGPNTIGVLGFPTPQSQMPVSINATYFGDTQITAQIGSDFYELDGTARLTADFGSRQVSELTLNKLSGQLFPALGATQSVSNVGIIKISGIGINGSGLSGGRSISSGGTIVLSGRQTNTLSGQFFGPNAEEAGGVWVIDDSVSKSTIVTGDFLTKN